MSEQPKSYGTSGGMPVDEAVIDHLVEEAERGYEDSQIRTGRRGRPSLGGEPARTVHVKVEPELFMALSQRALDEGATPSAVLRRALRIYLAG